MVWLIFKTFLVLVVGRVGWAEFVCGPSWLVSEAFSLSQPLWNDFLDNDCSNFIAFSTECSKDPPSPTAISKIYSRKVMSLKLNQSIALPSKNARLSAAISPESEVIHNYHNALRFFFYKVKDPLTKSS